jgi:hypothetical protein
VANLKKDRWVFAGAVAVALVLMFGFIARVIALADAQEEGRKDRADLRSDVGALGDALKRANKRLIKAGESPVTPPVAPPVDEPEVNDPDPDDPDPDDPERQDPERQQTERQDGDELAVDGDGGLGDPLDQCAHGYRTTATATTMAVLHAIAAASRRVSSPNAWAAASEFRPTGMAIWSL